MERPVHSPEEEEPQSLLRARPPQGGRALVVAFLVVHFSWQRKGGKGPALADANDPAVT